MTSWYNEDAVREDLELFQGGVLNNKIRVVHQRPPRVVLDEDEEVEDIRRQYGAISAVDEEYVDRAPDLGGIQMMLDNVHLCDGNSEYNPESKKDKNLQYGLVLTKPTAASVPPKQANKKVLNPNVKEFLPSTIQKHGDILCTSDSVSKTNNEVPLGTCGGNEESVKNNVKREIVEVKTETPSDSATVSQIMKTKYSNEVGSKASEIETLSNELKSKITSDGSFQGKLERNIALAKLLKLHSNQSLPESQPKLLTPQDFSEPVQAFKVQPSKKPLEVHVKPEKVTQQVNIDVPEKDIQQLSIDISDKDIADSISKVESWMQEGNKENDSVRQKTTILDKDHLNYKPTLTIPPTFKKVLSSSSETVQSSNSTASTPVPVSSRSSPRQFKPSGVASEFYLKFQNNQKAAERLTETIWTRAEREMKEKEEKVRLKQNEVSE